MDWLKGLMEEVTGAGYLFGLIMFIAGWLAKSLIDWIIGD